MSPAISKSQQQMFAIAKHSPKKLYKKNRGVLKMSKKEMDKFASTPIATLPQRVEPEIPPMQEVPTGTSRYAMPMKGKGMCKGGVVKK